MFKIRKILFTILDDAKVNNLFNNQYLSVLEQLTNITNAFQDEQKLITKDIPLKKCYRYLLSDTNLAKAKIFLQKADLWFPSNLKPFVIFISIVTHITHNSLLLKKIKKLINLIIKYQLHHLGLT